MGGGDGGLHEVMAIADGTLEVVQGRCDKRVVASLTEDDEALDLAAFGSVVYLENATVVIVDERGRDRPGPAIDTDDDMVATLDASQALALGLDESFFHDELGGGGLRGVLAAIGGGCVGWSGRGRWSGRGVFGVGM